MKKRNKKDNSMIEQQEKTDDIEVSWITLLKREDGYYAVPGGGYIKEKAHAIKAARNLARSNVAPVEPVKVRTVTRLEGASNETSVMSA